MCQWQAFFSNFPDNLTEKLRRSELEAHPKYKNTVVRKILQSQNGEEKGRKVLE